MSGIAVSSGPTATDDLVERLNMSAAALVQQRDRIAALEAERDALAKDAERWRKAEEIFKDMGWKERIIVCKVCDDDKCQEWHRVPTITKAIDAAMDAAKEK